MQYKIEKGDRFLCLEDYEMEDGRVLYTKGNIYRSDADHRITDNENDIDHRMYGLDDFFEYFKYINNEK
jgi:hypothetical protein